MNKIGVGFVGCGFAAAIHAEAFKRVPGFDVELVGVFSRNKSNSSMFAEKYGFSYYCDDFNRLLEDESIDIIDVITPPDSHIDYIKAAVSGNKAVIVEKPLSGCFTSGSVSKRKMYSHVMEQMEDLKHFLAEKPSAKVFYAENYIYAPSVRKMLDMLETSKEKLIVLKGEEAHSGSHAQAARFWEKTGGGSLIRQGCHPLSACIYLKLKESKVRLESVVADCSQIGNTLSDKGVLQSDAFDVEDMAEAVYTFSDGSKMIITGSDIVVGGVRNRIEAYTPASCLYADMAPNNALVCYNGRPELVDGVYITEKVEHKAGWQSVFVSEHEMRGYVGELEDFLLSYTTGKEPESGLDLAIMTVKAVYGAYVAAEEGIRFYF